MNEFKKCHIIKSWRTDGEAPAVYCPACEFPHEFDNRWAYNNNPDSPTFSPSMNIRTGPFPPGTKREGQIDICHSFVREGKIEYLSDCTHSMAGKTVDLPRFRVPAHGVGIELENA